MARDVRQEGDERNEFFSEMASTVNEEPSLTRQAELDAADINKILKRFGKTGIVPLANRQGAYIDVSEIGDYRSALEQVMKAREYFDTLPASSRAMFNNDPAEFLDKVQSLEDVDLLVEAGVIPKDDIVVPPVPPEGPVNGPPSP